MAYTIFRLSKVVDRQFFSQLFTIAVPIMLQNFVNSFVNMLDTFMIGRLGEAEISAAGLGNQIFFLLNLLLFAIGSSTSVFTGQFWGRKDTAGVAVTCILPLALLLPAIFNVSDEVIHIMHTLFFVLICFYPCRALNMNMVVGVFRAGGDTRFCLFYDVFFMWAAAIPLGFFAVRLGFSPALLYVCLMSEELFKMPCGLLRLRSGKWLHLV
ncbi:MAG: MATE family efflux transporter [Treponema sp.]